MELRVLGHVEAVDEGEPVALGGPRQRSVLAVLVANANQVISMDGLISEVWGESPPPAARNSLQSMVSNLRGGALKPDPRLSIDIEGQGYVLRAPPGAVDALAFGSRVDEARPLLSSDPVAAAGLLRGALELWRGRAYADLADESPLLSAEVVRLEELRLRALEYRLEADLAVGRAGDLVGELEALVDLHPLREGLYRLLMLALYRSGRQAEALRALSRLRRLLAAELGIEPSADLVHLEQQILDQTAEAPVSPPTDLEGGGFPSVRGYELRERIGESRLGVVYRAYQHSVGRQVAVRVVPGELANRPDFIRNFDGDAQVVSRLEHPHIVPLYDYWREPDAAFLVTRWIDGGTVIDVGQQAEPERVQRLVEQIGSALTLAHGRGVVHGDLSSRSVLVDVDGNAYVADFGVAGEAAVKGLSEHHLAPERRRGGRPSVPADVYSLGVLTWELLSGQP